MAFEVPPPKYVRLARTLQRRIKDGVYPSGALLPSENELAQTMGMARPTVARALELLKREGWIERRQGAGTFVRGVPEISESRSRLGLSALSRRESAQTGHVVDVGYVRVPGRIAIRMAVPTRTMMLRRRFLVKHDQLPQLPELVCCYFPRQQLDGTDLPAPTPLDEPIRTHVERRRKVRYDHITECVTARPARGDERGLLQLGRRDWLLSVLATAHDITDTPLHVAEVLLPADTPALEEVYRAS